jgi:hypothetical protein
MQSPAIVRMSAIGDYALQLNDAFSGASGSLKTVVVLANSIPRPSRDFCFQAAHTSLAHVNPRDAQSLRAAKSVAFDSFHFVFPPIAVFRSFP